MKKVLIALLALISQLAFAKPQVEFETNLGAFTVELNQQEAPLTVANFLKYVNDGSYVGSIFHRVIANFMAQGGGFDQQMQPLNSYAPIKNEAANGLQNRTATIAMARTQDPHSATRQFYINLVDNRFLDYDQRPPGYAVFGKVIKGFNVCEQMGRKPTHTLGRARNVPVEPIIITKVSLVE